MSILTPIYDDIKAAVDREELLALLAEECTELAQAALKLRRAMTGEDPTPVSKGMARLAVDEEVADVLVSLALCGDWIVEADLRPDVAETFVRKLVRFRTRLAMAGEDVEVLP